MVGVGVGLASTTVPLYIGETDIHILIPIVIYEANADIVKNFFRQNSYTILLCFFFLFFNSTSCFFKCATSNHYATTFPFRPNGCTMYVKRLFRSKLEKLNQL